MSCQYCRLRHSKCDDQIPQCRPCQRANRQCIRAPRLNFRRSSHTKPFRQDQTWLPLPTKLNYVDETPVQQEIQHFEIARETRATSTDSIQSPIHQQSSDAEEGFFHTHSQSFSSNSSPISYRSPIERQRTETQSSPSIATDAQPNQDVAETPVHSLHRTTSHPKPFESRQEAELLRHFIDHVSCFFDACDPTHQFGYEVVRRARYDTLLANAIMALSARHLHRTSTFDPYLSDHYYQSCLQTLIPALSHTSAGANDNLLAATVILRLLEEMDVPIVGTDLQKHLIGTQAIIAASHRYSEPSATPLRYACYWAAYRQEIYISLMTQRPFQLSIPDLDLSTASGEDWIWALKATQDCGEVLKFVFGNTSNDQNEYNSMLQVILSWQSQMPQSFSPLFYDSRGNNGTSCFPGIQLQADFHVMGTQYNLLAHVLLIVHQPLPKVGPARKQAIDIVDNQAREVVKTICGVAISNPQTSAAILVASMSIALFGDRFDYIEDQKELRDVLIKTEILHGWPTKTAQHQLELAWGWIGEDC